MYHSRSTYCFPLSVFVFFQIWLDCRTLLTNTCVIDFLQVCVPVCLSVCPFHNLKLLPIYAFCSVLVDEFTGQVEGNFWSIQGHSWAIVSHSEIPRQTASFLCLDPQPLLQRKHYVLPCQSVSAAVPFQGERHTLRSPSGMSRPSVVCLSVTFVRPAHRVELFVNTLHHIIQIQIPIEI